MEGDNHLGFESLPKHIQQNAYSDRTCLILPEYIWKNLVLIMFFVTSMQRKELFFP